MQQEYPAFTKAVRALGKTRRERAAAFAIGDKIPDPKTIDRLLRRLPEPLKIFHAQPHLLRELADDLERLKTQAPN